MATFGIFVAFGDKSSSRLKGISAVDGYKDWLMGETLNLNATATRVDGAMGKTEKRVVAHVDSLSVLLNGSSANAELYAALFATTNFAEVYIHQCLQPVDKAAKVAPELIQEYLLKNVYVTGISEAWEASSPRLLSVQLEFSYIMHTIGKKTADFTVRNTG